ncbi:hypothetical protein [Undibacterium sp. Tian12W]|uniref:hypothetical protein n=1 Tax=Undibacterium sp. Tian12W TaxID=3413054 RepID=UPI003BEFF31F
MRGKQLIFCLVTMATLVGCSNIPMFSPDPKTKMTNIRVMNFGQYEICQKGKRYRLPLKWGAGDEMSIQVPTGDVIGLAVFKYEIEYKRSSSCMPGFDFRPMENQSYVMNNGVHGNKCFAEIVRIDGSKDRGISLEPNMTEYSCKP